MKRRLAIMSPSVNQGAPGVAWLLVQDALYNFDFTTASGSMHSIPAFRIWQTGITAGVDQYSDRLQKSHVRGDIERCFFLVVLGQRIFLSPHFKEIRKRFGAIMNYSSMNKIPTILWL